jgi:hypothetical protein
VIYDLKAGRLSRPAPSGLRRPDVQTNPIRPGLGRARFQVDERCETKPIARNGAPRGVSIADFGLGTDLGRDALCWPPGHELVLQTKPIPRYAGWGEARGAWGDGANAQNKANLARRGRATLPRPCQADYATSPRCPASGNKPKLGRAGVSRRQDGRDERRANASNKPNSSIADCGSGTDLRRDALCWPLGRRPVVQTNPIGRSQSCKTNPITRSGAPRRCPAGPAGQELGGRGAGAIVQNEANFRSSRRADGTGARHRMAATPPRRRNLIDSRCRAPYYRFPASRGARPARYPVRPRGAKRTTPNA